LFAVITIHGCIRRSYNVGTVSEDLHCEHAGEF